MADHRIAGERTAGRAQIELGAKDVAAMFVAAPIGVARGTRTEQRIALVRAPGGAQAPAAKRAARGLVVASFGKAGRKPANKEIALIRAAFGARIPAAKQVAQRRIGAFAPIAGRGVTNDRVALVRTTRGARIAAAQKIAPPGVAAGAARRFIAQHRVAGQRAPDRARVTARTERVAPRIRARRVTETTDGARITAAGWIATEVDVTKDRTNAGTAGSAQVAVAQRVTTSRGTGGVAHAQRIARVAAAGRIANQVS